MNRNSMMLPQKPAAVLYIIDISILTLQICNQGPPKQKMWPPPPSPFIPFWSWGVRIVIISFRNIVKKLGKILILFPIHQSTFPQPRYEWHSRGIHGILFSPVHTAKIWPISQIWLSRWRTTPSFYNNANVWSHFCQMHWNALSKC